MKKFSFVFWMLGWPIVTELIFILYQFLSGDRQLDNYFAVLFIIIYFFVASKLWLDNNE